MQLFTHLRQRQFETANLAISRQDGFFERYLDWLDTRDEAEAGDRRVTILARSPQSPAVCALIGRVEELKARRVVARALVARIEPQDALREMVDAMLILSPDLEGTDLVRWANNSCLLDAHEQLTLGTGMCWSGDMMRRDPSKRDGLDLFEADAPQTVRLGALAFNAIWSISAPIPGSSLRARRPRLAAAYARELSEALPKAAFLREAQRPPLTRH